MNIAIKLSPAERIRRAKAADPSLSDEQLREQLGVTAGQIKAAMLYRKQKAKRRT
ncbi:MAG TPA: hypothetical protein VGN60_00680 [Devosia sp.]|jgi:Mn-containing catalase|nr:hypothetical protein [Devosia sp.]